MLRLIRKDRAFVQYFWHVIVLLQKLAYLHGWPELFQDDEQIDDETKGVLTLFVGVMLDADRANDGLGKLAAARRKTTSRPSRRAPVGEQRTDRNVCDC